MELTTTIPAQRDDLLFAIPPEESRVYTRSVSYAALKEVEKLLDIMRRIHDAPKVRPACKRIAAELLAPRSTKAWSSERLCALYYKFVRANGDWKVLLNKAKAPVDREQLGRFAFREFWRKLGEDHQRDWAAAHNELLQIWRTGFDFKGRKHTRIPGYETWPAADDFTDIPDGWSYPNLMRHVSDPYDQAAARVGRGKASEHRLPVLTKRVGLRVGEYYEFDDHEFDQKVLFQKKPMRPLGFGVVDVLSGCVFQTGFKPTLWDYEEEARRKLTEREFMWFVVAVLCGTGYRRDKIGTRLIVERGMAAIREDFEERIVKTIGEDYIRIERGGRVGRNAHAGQFDGRSKGNPRTKLLIEGVWRMVNDQTDSLPGQVGKDRNSAPEQLYGAEQYTAAIQRRADELMLSDADKALLQFPFPPWTQWQKWALEAFHRINTARNHDLKGWEELGFVQPVWRLPGIETVAAPLGAWLPWTKFLELPTTQQAVVKSMLDTDPSLVKTVRLCRQEVFNAGRKELTKVPLELMPSLVGRENALNGGVEPIPVEKGLFRFECAEMDPEPLEFYARDERGSAYLQNGSKYICFVNPYLPSHLVACDDALRVIAVCPRYIRPCRSDTEAVGKLLGEQSEYEAAARVRLNLRHADAAEDKRAMKEHNERLLAAAAVSPATAGPLANDCTNDLLAREGQVQPPADESW